MLKTLAFTPLLGLPLLAWGGLTALILLLAAATIGALTIKGKIKAPVALHVWLARIGLFFALIHGLVGILAFLL